MTQRCKRRGVSLIELLVVITCMVIVLNFGAVLVLAAMRLDQMSAETVHRITRQSQLADLFRGDVRNGVAALDAFHEYRSGPNCLILRQKGERHIVYRIVDGGLEQITLEGDNRTRRPISWGPAETIAEFERTDGLVTLKIAERNKGITGMKREISAALGGDLQ